MEVNRSQLPQLPVREEREDHESVREAGLSLAHPSGDLPNRGKPVLLELFFAFFAEQLPIPG